MHTSCAAMLCADAAESATTLRSCDMLMLLVLVLILQILLLLLLLLLMPLLVLLGLQTCLEPYSNLG